MVDVNNIESITFYEPRKAIINNAQIEYFLEITYYKVNADEWQIIYYVPGLNGLSACQIDGSFRNCSECKDAETYKLTNNRLGFHCTESFKTVPTSEVKNKLEKAEKEEADYSWVEDNNDRENS